MPSIKVRGLPPLQDHRHTGPGDGGTLPPLALAGVVDNRPQPDAVVENGLAEVRLVQHQIVASGRRGLMEVG